MSEKTINLPAILSEMPLKIVQSRDKDLQKSLATSSTLPRAGKLVYTTCLRIINFIICKFNFFNFSILNSINEKLQNRINSIELNWGTNRLIQNQKTEEPVSIRSYNLKKVVAFTLLAGVVYYALSELSTTAPAHVATEEGRRALKVYASVAQLPTPWDARHRALAELILERAHIPIKNCDQILTDVFGQIQQIGWIGEYGRNQLLRSWHCLCELQPEYSRPGSFLY